MNLELTSRLALYIDLTTSKKHTFSTLRQQSVSLGTALVRKWSWQKGDILALFTPNIVEISTVVLGTLWAGGVVCPFNNLYTVLELSSLLKSSGAKGLVTHVSCLDVALQAAKKVGLSTERILVIGEKVSSGKVGHLQDLMKSGNGGRMVQTKTRLYPGEDMAFLVYSSGTTGLPKGVMLTHRNFVANMLQAEVVDQGSQNWKEDSMISFLPMFHIYGTYSDVNPISGSVDSDADIILYRYRSSNLHTPPPRGADAYHAALRPGAISVFDPEV